MFWLYLQQSVQLKETEVLLKQPWQHSSYWSAHVRKLLIILLIKMYLNTLFVYLYVLFTFCSFCDV